MVALEQVFRQMVKVTRPLGSETAHGAVGQMFIFQGTHAKAYRKPRNNSTAVQGEVRTDFRDVSKILAAAGLYPRAVFYFAIGQRWYADLCGCALEDWEFYYSAALVEFEGFEEADKLAWDQHSPLLPGTFGVGKVFFAVLNVAYWRMYYKKTRTFGYRLFGAGEAGAAAAWWGDSNAVFFETGVYDDGDLRFNYSERWHYDLMQQATNGNYHRCYDVEITTCSFSFRGIGLKVIYPKEPNAAIMKIVIDGVDLSFSQNGASIEYQAAWESPALAYGMHYVEISQIGMGFITLDGIEVL